MFYRRDTNGDPPLRTRRYKAACAICLLGVMLCGAALAQDINRLLLDPRPIPGSAQSMPLAAVGLPALPERAAATGNPQEDITRYLGLIASEELAGGPYAPELLEQYLALGEAYQRGNDHEAALAAFEKADHVSRINNGLHSPEQFAIVEDMIVSHLARGEVMEAANKQRYLLLLHEELYGEASPNLVPALTDVADWNFTTFKRQITQPNTVVSLSFNAPRRFGGGSASSPRAMAFGSLYQAQANYRRAISILLSNGRYSDPQLPELERKLIEVLYLASNRESLMENPDFYMSRRSAYTGTRIKRSTMPYSPNFYTGRSAYERLMAYHLITAGTDAMTVAQTLVALGDWNLLYDRQSTAITQYRSAHDFLVANGVAQEQIDALLSPVVPQQLPTFTPVPHSRARFGLAADAEVPWDGYVDVSFRVSRFGHASDIDVLGSTGPLTEDIEKRLRRLVRGYPFRPRFIDGAPSTRDQVSIRYYFAVLN